MLVTNKWEKKGLYIQHKGVVSSKDMLDADRNYRNAKFDALSYIIVDLSLVTNFTFNFSRMEEKAAQSNVEGVWKDKIKLVFVVTTPKVRELIEYYVSLMEEQENNWDLFIVDSEENARRLVTVRLLK
ncbi:MAG: hypothetical protein JKY54_14690 [Flavobacteriales bacterium]|nr:hypothetical protein [Flavobacteriales bacterium]